MNKEPKDFILASGSPHRLSLLRTIGYEPKKIASANIDESEKKHEKPLAFVKRMALEKAQKAASLNPGENILSADTVVVVNSKILHKSKTPEEQRKVMDALSGKAHKVITSVCLCSKTGRISQRTVTTRILMKKMSEQEIRDYVACDEWVGVVGYSIEGRLGAYVKKIIGSYSGVVGLPLYETKNLLNGENIL